MKFLFKLVLIFTYILFSINTVEAKVSCCSYKVIKDSDGVYVVEVKTSKTNDCLVPYVVKDLETNETVYENTGAKFSVNAGFFDPKNQKTISYITIDKELVANPEENENLMENQVLRPYLDKILNRSEFRVLENENGGILYDIAAHKDAVIEGYEIKHSIQSGPMLFPELKLEEEFFILVKDEKIVSESASSLHKYARTAIGIKENNVYLFIITTEAPMTLEEVSNLARKWGMEKAMAFDGGGSTSYKDNKYEIVSEKDNQARKVKSFLLLKPFYLFK